MLRITAFASVLLVVCLVANVQASPLSIRIDDHTFAFDVSQDAVYDYNGANPDHLYVPAIDTGHYVGTYTYTGAMPTVPTNPLGTPPSPSSDSYPLYSGYQFAANLELDMYFNTNDGPYTDPVTSDAFEISLVGHRSSPPSRLKITGWIANTGWPPGVLYPAGSPQNITLLDIEFSDVTLLARADSDTADLVEGKGILKTLLGVDVTTDPDFPGGACFFKFMAPSGIPIFSSAVYDPTGAGSQYDPGIDYFLNPVDDSRIAGRAGVIPEPMSLALLGLGGIGLLLKRRR